MRGYAAWLVIRPAGCPVGRRDCGVVLVGWLADLLVGWLAAWLVGRCVGGWVVGAHLHAAVGLRAASGQSRKPSTPSKSDTQAMWKACKQASMPTGEQQTGMPTAVLR